MKREGLLFANKQSRQKYDKKNLPTNQKCFPLKNRTAVKNAAFYRLGKNKLP